MRLTYILRAQHLGFMTKRHWLVQGKRIVRETGARDSLERNGIKIVDIMDVAYPPQPRIKLPPIVGYYSEPIALDEKHEFWNERHCHMYGNSSVLLEGLKQAQVLTKTLLIPQLPDSIRNFVNKINISAGTEQTIRSSIMNAHVFDAEQQKLPKTKLPDRPAFVLPREYGISESRRFRLLINKLHFECEKLSGRSTTRRRALINDAFFVVPLEKNNELIQMEINAETFIATQDPIELPVNTQPSADLPNLFPVKYTVSMQQENIYHKRNSYPLSIETTYQHPHTIFLHYSPSDVINLYGTEVTADQYKSRSMLKAFTVAAAAARRQFGPNVKDLPKPIVVQSIHSDGRAFYFGIYQLNTLNLDDATETRNYWYHLPDTIDLYNECGYREGRPIMSGYRNDVFKHIYAFYRNN